MFEEVFKQIKKEDHLDDLFQLLRQKSVSSTGVGIEETAYLLKSTMESYGIDTKLFHTEGNPIVYGEVINSKNTFTLLIYGHYDVQPSDPLDEWDSNPFEPIIRNNRIYARGVGDNKGQFFAHLIAVKVFLEKNKSLPINVKFIIEGEEEISSPNLRNFVDNHKSLLKSDMVLTADGPGHFSDLPLILLGVRGNLKINISLKTSENDNHSGNQGNIVPNPVWDLINLLSTMRDSNGEILIEGFYEDIIPPTYKEKKLMESLPFDKEIILYSTGMKNISMDKKNYYEQLMFTPTFNIAGIESGYTGPGYKTIIPSKASINIDMRLVANQDPEDIFQKVKGHIQEYLPEAECSLIGKAYPSRTKAEHPYVSIIEKSLYDASNQEVLIQPSLGGTVPDSIWTKTLKVPSVIVPYANFDHANHAPNENLKLDKFKYGILSTAHIIKNLGNFNNS